MTFDTLERARFGGRPVRLFRFQIQGAVWWFAQATSDVTTLGGIVWTAAQIDRDPVRQTSERAKDSLKIRMPYLRDPNAPLIDLPATQAIGDLWHPYIPSSRVQVMCFSHHHGSADAPVLDWSGEVAQPEYTDVQLELTCTPGIAITEAKNQGPLWQRACWKVTYSVGLRGCNLDPADFLIPATLDTVTGLTLTAAAFATAPFSLMQGQLQWTRTLIAHNGSIDIIESRTIISHAGATVQIAYGGLELAPALEVNGLPDCPRTWAACVERNNTINFGGAIYKPVENPEGQSMSWG